MGKDMRSGFAKSGSSNKKKRHDIVAGAVARAERTEEKPRHASVGAKNVGEYKKVKIKTVRPNDYNYNKMDDTSYAKLKDNISEFGFNTPIIVRSGNETGTFPDNLYEIVNGYHRWKAASELGMTSIQIINLGNVSDVAAKAMTVNLNELHGSPDHEALAAILSEISKEQPDLIGLLPYSAAEFDSMVSAGASDLALLDSLHSPNPISDESEGSSTKSGSEDGEDDDGEVDPVYEILGLGDMEEEVYDKVLSDLRDLNETLGYEKGDGKLLPRIIRLALKKFSAKTSS